MLLKCRKKTNKPHRNVVKYLKIKYCESLSRKYIDLIDMSLMGEVDKEDLRKLKISFANKGRKPWNVGRQHRPDTLQRIKEKTRLAMCRFEVRKRWEAGWKPKSHSQETKEKLRNIMKQKQNEKTVWMKNWLNKEIGIEMSDYMCLPPRFRSAYKRMFNLKWRIHKAKSFEEREKLVRSLHEVNIHILKIYAFEAKRLRFMQKKSRKRTKHGNKFIAMKKRIPVMAGNNQDIKRKNRTEREEELIDVSFDMLKHSSRPIAVDGSKTFHSLIDKDLNHRLTNYGKTSQVFTMLIECYNKEIRVLNKNIPLKISTTKALAQNLMLTSLVKALFNVSRQ